MMKSNLIFITLIIGSYGQQGPLSAEENQQRLETCGRVNDSVPPSWLIPLIFKGRGALGVLITPRHILTSSFASFDQHLEDLMLVNCPKGSDDYEGIRVEDYSSSRSIPLKMRRIYLPKICSREILDHFNGEFSPMIVEIAENLDVELPCLGEGELGKSAGNWVSLIGGGIQDNQTEFAVESPYFYSIHKDVNLHNPGSILEQVIDGKRTVFGIKTSGFRTSGQNNFFNIAWFEDSLCSQIGVCNATMTTTIGTTTTISEFPTTTNDGTELPEIDNSTMTTMRNVSLITYNGCAKKNFIGVGLGILMVYLMVEL